MGLSVLKAVVLFALLIVCANSQLDFQVSGLSDERNPKTEAVEERDNILYQPQVIIESPGCSVDTSPSCNCTKIQELMSAELQATNRQLQQLQTAVSDQQGWISSGLEDAKLQLHQLQLAVADIAGLLTKFSVSPPTEQTPLPTAPVTDSEDCTKLLANSDGPLESGVYMIQPLDGGPLVQVYCDMETDGGGWTVFQRRQDGSVDFYRNFSDYRQGFGNLEGEFWLGNDNLHRLTAQGVYELRVDLEDFQGNSTYAVYDTFAVGALEDSYRLELGNYTGYVVNTLGYSDFVLSGDSLSSSNYQQFSTWDRDRDIYGDNCAVIYHGAWWFKNCFSAHLNGEYGATEYARGIQWGYWQGYSRSLKGAEMKIRKKY